MTISWEKPGWDAPVSVHAVFTNRGVDAAESPYANLNLSDHVGDDPWLVSLNRERLVSELTLPSKPMWMNQVHSAEVVEVGAESASSSENADGTYTNQPDVVLVMLVADCLPVILCSETGEEVAVLHAGWRGLAGDVIANGIEKFAEHVNYAWVGPGIGPCHYEVDMGVRQNFTEFVDAFHDGRDAHHWMLDLKRIAVLQLKQHGVKSISVSDRCTYCEPARYFSARRDKDCGRMAALVWTSSR